MSWQFALQSRASPSEIGVRRSDGLIGEVWQDRLQDQIDHLIPHGFFPESENHLGIDLIEAVVDPIVARRMPDQNAAIFEHAVNVPVGGR